MFRISELEGMRKIDNTKISLANFFPDYAVTYNQDNKSLYEVYFMNLSTIEVDKKIYTIYSPQLASFYFFLDERNIIKEYFDTLNSLFAN